MDHHACTKPHKVNVNTAIKNAQPIAISIHTTKRPTIAKAVVETIVPATHVSNRHFENTLEMI